MCVNVLYMSEIHLCVHPCGGMVTLNDGECEFTTHSSNSCIVQDVAQSVESLGSPSSISPNRVDVTVNPPPSVIPWSQRSGTVKSPGSKSGGGGQSPPSTAPSNSHVQENSPTSPVASPSKRNRQSFARFLEETQSPTSSAQSNRSSDSRSGGKSTRRRIPQPKVGGTSSLQSRTVGGKKSPLPWETQKKGPKGTATSGWQKPRNTSPRATSTSSRSRTSAAAPGTDHQRTRRVMPESSRTQRRCVSEELPFFCCCSFFVSSIFCAEWTESSAAA